MSSDPLRDHHVAIPSRDLCVFLLSSVKDLTRILQGNDLFPEEIKNSWFNPVMGKFPES
jgi:hypothetical protein